MSQDTLNDVQSAIRKAVAMADKREKGATRGILKRFISQFYEDCPPDDLAETSAEDLYAAASSAFTFAKTRRKDRPSIRVIIPKKGKGKTWLSDRTVIEIINDDMPFLVDSVTAELERLGEPAQFIIHPVVPVKRDGAGKLLDVFADDEPFLDEGERIKQGVHFESMMHIQIPLETDPELLDRIGDTLQSVLSDVRVAVSDWPEMRRQATRIAADFDGAPAGVTREQAAEVEDFLHWLHDDHYTFLGYRAYTIESKGKRRILHMQRDENLGVLTKPSLFMFDGVRDGTEVPPLFAQFISNESPLLIIKANQRATVHRRVHYDVIVIKTLNDKGETIGLRLFAGMFTADVYTNSPNFVPVLRRKIDRIRDRIGFRKHSHDGKRLQNIMENLPRDELFESSDDHLADVALGILHLQERSRTALFVREDNFQRFVSCLVYVSRDRFDTQLRLKITDLLVQAFKGRLSSFFTQVTDSPLARVHFIIATTPGQVPDVDVEALEGQLARASRAWHDDLDVALREECGEAQGRELFDRYAYAFPASYRDQYACDVAVFDIGKVEDLIAGEKIAMHLHLRSGGDVDGLYFKVYAKGGPLPLSDVLPVIENMGFTVISEVPHQVTPRGSAVGGGPV